MSAGRGFLDRLRPVGAPGAAARRGVPADRLAEIRAELEPLFGLLAEIDATAERIRREARDQTDHTIRAGREHAESVVAEARSRAEAERARVVAAGRARAAAEEVRLIRGADVEAARLRAHAGDALPGLVESAVAFALAELDESAGALTEPSATASAQDVSRP